MKQHEFEDKAKELFDDSVDGLDAATLSRLNAGRHAALEAGAKRPALLRFAPVGGVAAAAALAVLLFQPQQEAVIAPSADATDFEILMSDDNLDMLQDLEFYAWMDIADAELDDPGSG